MPGPPEPSGYVVEAVRAWQLRCVKCGRRSPVLPDEPDPFLDAEAWARAHTSACPAREPKRGPGGITDPHW